MKGNYSYSYSINVIIYIAEIGILSFIQPFSFWLLLSILSYYHITISYHRNVLEQDSSSMSTKKVYFKVLHLNPIKINLSYASTFGIAQQNADTYPFQS